jgi:hypothetical protein
VTCSRALAHPQVRKVDFACMEAATGHRIHHMECIVRGGRVCRFLIGADAGPAGVEPPTS